MQQDAAIKQQHATTKFNYEITSKVTGFGNVWSKLQQSSVPTSTCTNQNNKLLSLLNLLCNTTQTTSLTSRDACYGCFFRAGSLTDGTTLLQQLSQCSNMYLIGSNYEICATQLQLIINGTITIPTNPSTTNCYNGYCEFVRCVRRINANTLIDLCFMENLINRDLTIQVQRIYFYTNVTACILAKTRCSIYNPISGQLQQLQLQQQQQQQYYQYGKPNYNNIYHSSYSSYQNYYNSLQISKNGDIRLITFPLTINVSDLFCSRITTLEQSNYNILSC